MRYSDMTSRNLWLFIALFMILAGTALTAQPDSENQPAPGGGREQLVPQNLANAQLLKVEKESFTVGEIAAAYNRTLPKNGINFYDLPRDSALGFINLYANYRLKVLAAKDLKLDESQQYRTDMERNRDQVALGATGFGGISGDGYLFQRKLVDPGARRVYDRRDQERKIAVIFSAAKPTDPADTLRAYKRSQNMLKLLEQGVNFQIIAADSTDDASTQAKGGVIGWITGGMVLKELEDAAWATPEGQVYPGIIPVETGYVLLKVMDVDKREKVRVAHILFEVTKDINSNTNDAESRKKADEALARIRAGEDFAAVAEEVSSDRTSAVHGGDLMVWYTRSLGFESRSGKLAPEFEDAIFGLKDGEVSDVVKTSYGYEIIKRLESKVPTFAEEEKAIRDIYKRLFLERDKKEYTDAVLKKYGFWLDPATFEALLLSIDTNRSAADKEWANHITDNLRKRELFRFLGESFSVQAWVDSVETNPRLRALPLSRQSVHGSFVTLLEYQAMKEEAKGLEKEYPEFARLMNEFRDGALIFELEQQNVYSKIGYDEEAGKAFFESRRSEYMAPPKLALSEIFIYTESNARDIYRRAKDGEDFATLASNYTERQGYREKSGKWEMNGPTNSELVRKVLETTPNPKAGMILEPIKYQGAWSILRIDEVAPAHQESYEEARSEVMADYNDWREKKLRNDMIASFRSKYSVTINEKALDAALKARK